LAGVALTYAAPSAARDGFGGAITVTSDYVYRGVSQTQGEPALQGDLHYASPRGWSIGVWGSTVELNAWEGQTVELNAYAGYRWLLNREWDAKVSAVVYDYPENDGRIRYDYNEIVGTVGYRNVVFATIAWSGDTARYASGGYYRSGHTVSYELATALPLMGSLTANLGVGYFDLHDVVDAGYLYWNAGLSYTWRALRADLSYIGTDNHAEQLSYGEFAGDRMAASLSWHF
jgi:uncharacterized protein (TIGR02001 family)